MMALTNCTKDYSEEIFIPLHSFFNLSAYPPTWARASSASAVLR